MLIRIDDPRDPRIAAYRDVRERDLAGRDGGFIAEGEVVLAKAVAAGRHPLTSLLLDAKRVAGLKAILDRLGDDIPVFTAGQAVLDVIVGFPIHRGILALGRRAPPPPVHDLLGALPDRAVVLVLLGIANHDNMGGLFRNAAAFGVNAVLLGADCCDPLYRKSIRVSVGAALTTPFAVFASGDDPVALLRRHGFEALALSPLGSEPLHRLVPATRTAVILGAEGPGLPPAILAQARTVSIPMAGGFDSLNVAVTAGIVLHHLAGAATA